MKLISFIILPGDNRVGIRVLSNEELAELRRNTLQSFIVYDRN